jgi:organic hydroperoxide reductase OsmC/OhrA
MDEAAYEQFVKRGILSTGAAMRGPLNIKPSSPGRATGEAFTDGKFSRAHQWSFDGGITVPDPRIAPVRAHSVLPREARRSEEALVAALSSCHMLTFSISAPSAAPRRDSYQDEAVGV